MITIFAKEVKNTNGMYFICDDGVVYTKYHKNGMPRFMSTFKSRDGYVCVGINISGKQKQFRVHRLIGEYFIANPESKPYINHIDGVRHNNHFLNLEWCTQKENVHHAIHTLNKWSQSEKQSQAARATGLKRRKLTFKQAQELRLEYSVGNTSSIKLSKKYGLSKPCVLRIINNTSYTQEDLS